MGPMKGENRIDETIEELRMEERREITSRNFVDSGERMKAEGLGLRGGLITSPGGGVFLYGVQFSVPSV